MMSKSELANLILEKKLVDVYDFLDLSYAHAREKEIRQGKLHKQKNGDGIAPTLRTNCQNLAVVVYA